MLKSLKFAAFLIASIAFSAVAQTPTPTPRVEDDNEVIKVESRLIVVPVSVTDQNGYGEVQRAGAYRVERQMTVLQALSPGGGLSPRGTQRGIRIHRRGEDGAVRVTNPQLNDPVQRTTCIVVREALF